MNERAIGVGQRYAQLAAAPHWVRAHGWDYSAELAERTIAHIRRRLAAGPRDHLLEVGCGSGALLSALLRDDQTGVGVDPCEELLAQAPRFGVDPARVTLLRGEAARLPLPDSQFDRVLCFGVFLYFPNLRYAVAALDELVRVCKPGGTIVVGDVPGYAERVRAMWRQYGLRADTVAAILKLPSLTPLRWALSPWRPLYRGVQRLRGRRETGDEGAYDYLWYGHSFFRRWAAQGNVSIEILAQDIAGRDASRVRFDVRLTKPQLAPVGSSRPATVPMHPASGARTTEPEVGA